jgi:hypothetical protein
MIKPPDTIQKTEPRPPTIVGKTGIGPGAIKVASTAAVAPRGVPLRELRNTPKFKGGPKPTKKGHLYKYTIYNCVMVLLAERRQFS